MPVIDGVDTAAEVVERMAPLLLERVYPIAVDHTIHHALDIVQLLRQHQSNQGEKLAKGLSLTRLLLLGFVITHRSGPHPYSEV